MSKLKATSFRTGVLGIVLLLTLAAFKGEKDSLHKRTFNIMLDELKDGVPVKAGKKGIADKFYFKEGKVFSDFLNEKFGYKWMRYRINKDSIFTDSTDTEVRWLEVESSATNEDNQTVMINFTSVEWDLDGTVKITKNDKIKKYYDIVGREKGGKPKKPKKPKANKVFEIVEPGTEPSTEENRK
ncbi:hypothetical protein CNR22_17490 [Sphingobacteriaceae bacterium]|nr:hypothetical protein CNR22_17490 [Sphingobacteriaceae bacterium]